MTERHIANHYWRFAKRLLDIALASMGLVLLFPVLAILAVAIRVRLGSPVLFQQWRPGLRGRPFVLMKFRTMTNATDDRGNPLSDSERLTPFGCFLRRASLDELPTLWNVLRGDMSLVGPRPLLMQYLERYSAQQARRHEVSPGITGWAQIHGRNDISWEEKFALDVWYVDNWSFWLDLKILASTVVTVARGHGVSHGGEATMPEFAGSGVEALDDTKSVDLRR